MRDLRWVDAVDVEDLWQGDILDVEVDADQVLIVHHLDGTIKAFQGICPHQEVLLADGKWDEDKGILVCPGHNWEFDLTSGTGVNPEGCRLYEYPVQVVDGSVQVGIPQDGTSHYNRCTG